MDNKFISIGKISGSHGVKGFAKVYPLTDYIERFDDLERVFLFHKDKKPIELQIEDIKDSNKFLLIKFDFFKDPETVNLYKGALIKIPFSERYEIEEEDVFYIDDLLGLDAYLTDGTYIGKVRDVYEEPNVVLEIVTKDNKEVLVPFVNALVKDVDTKNKKVTIENLQGLFDDNFELG
ncbi:MAG: ribosome maturation factor RimM [Candidatus Sericytochromatia bacterium]